MSAQSAAVLPLSDERLFREFEELSLHPAQFTHRNHLRVAWLYLRRYGFAEGSLRFNRQLRHYVTAVGAEAKYHETITWAYLAILNEERVLRGSPDESFDALLARRPDLLDHRNGALARYYSAEQLALPEARRVFLLPRG